MIEKSYSELPTWKLMIDMLKSNRDLDNKACVNCLKLMTNKTRVHWRSILDANGSDRLCDILKRYVTKLSPPVVQVENKNKSQTLANASSANENRKELEELTCDAISVLCNLADQYEIKEKLSQTSGLLEMLTKIVCLSPNEDIQSRVSILIADVASIDQRNKSTLASHGCLSRLLDLLNKSPEDLLINTVNAIEVLCLDNVDNQTFCARNGAFESFMDLLQLNSGIEINYLIVILILKTLF